MGIYATAVIPYDGKLIIFDTPVLEAAPLAENTDRGRIFSIDEILQKRYGEDFHEYITNYICLKPESVAKKLGVSGTPSMKALHTRFNRVESVIGQKPCAMIVDVVVTSVIEAELPADGNGFLSEGTAVGFANHECGGQAGSGTPETGKDSCPPPDAGSALRTRCRRTSVDFRLRYLLDMRKGFGNVIGPIVTLYRELDGDALHSPLLIRATKYLLPVMYEDDYDRLGRRMLERFYPEALRDRTAVDGRVLAERMGLKVVYTSYPAQSGIMGQLFFEDGKLTVENADGSPVTLEADRDTIYINLRECRTDMEVNSTIIHECVHRFKDLYFFLLQCMAGRDYTSHINRRRKRRAAPYGKRKTGIDWMELQAEKMPAHILLEKESTAAVIEELLSRMGGCRSPENMRRIMNSLADRFRVTKCMAKIRMKQLGYEEAEGIYNFVEGSFVPDHGCSGAWPKGVTFTLSPAELQKAVSESPEFAKELSRKRYAYVEGHVCLDAPEYVRRWNGMKARLTEYARRHIDLCCLGWSFHGRSGGAAYEAGVASKLKSDKAGLCASIRLDSLPGTAEWERDNKKVSLEAEKWGELAKMMTGDFKESFDIVRRARGITVAELSRRLGISVQYYSKMINGRISTSQLVGICVELNLRIDISFRLLELSGNRLTYKEVDCFYMTMLASPEEFTLERCNDILKSNGYPPFFPRSKNSDDSMG